MCEKQSLPSNGIDKSRLHPGDYSSPVSLSTLLASRPLPSFVMEPLPYLYREEKSITMSPTSTTLTTLPASTPSSSFSSSHDEDNLAFLFLDQPWPMRTHRSDLLAAVLDRSMELAQLIPPLDDEQHQHPRSDDPRGLLVQPHMANCRNSGSTASSSSSVVTNKKGGTRKKNVN